MNLASRCVARSALRLACIAAAMPLAFAASVAVAQGYPSKPIRIIVPFPPGGSADLVARTVAQKMSENIKQPVVIDNRPGADTIIAMEQVAKAAPDGYTVGYAIGSALTMNPTLYAKLPYDPVKDFAPVSVVANVPLALVVHPSVEAKTAKELADFIKANPDKLFYGQANIVAKVATEAFSRAVGGKMTEVAYKGSTPNVQDLVVGRVQVSIEPVATVLPHVQTGKLRALAVTDSKRSPVFPDLPTVAETGVKGYAFNNWHAIVVPAGTPKDVVAKLHEEIVKAARDPDVAAKVAPMGVEMVGSTPEDLQKRAATERDFWGTQIKAMGIRLD
jgi:tripartite-type tricarboxylate transporter receptor subunit TctC